MSIPFLDTHDFTRRGDTARGTVPVAGLSRLVTMLASPDGELSWRVDGRSEVGADGSRRAFLRLEFGAGLRMHCVRCLEPVDLRLDESRDYRLVTSEEQAEREDPDEDDVDLLTGSRRFDLAALIEDEAIMALPPAPRHADCRAPAPAAVAEAPAGTGPADAPQANPFAALRALREPPGGEGTS